MHILIITNYFPPEVGAASYLYQDLAETLIDRGHSVTVVTGFPRYRIDSEPRGRRLTREDRVGRVDVVRVLSSTLDRGGPVRRGLDHLYLAPSLAVGGLLAKRPDVVLAYSPPLTLGLTAWALAGRWSVPWVVNIQDLFPQYAVDIGLLTNRYLIRAFERLESFVYRSADAVVVNSPRSRDHVLLRGGSDDRVHAISNWVDTDFIRPGPSDNGFRQEIGLAGKFVVQYAGTMGYQQDLDTLMDAAGLLRDREDIHFQLIGDGVERERLQERARGRGLRNVSFTPFQPRETYPAVVQSADACVVTLKNTVRTPAVPSKLLGIMAAGKPVLMSALESGDAPGIVREAGCGIVIPPGEPEEFARAVRFLYEHPETAASMAERSRQHAERKFSRQICVRRLEDVLESVIVRRRAGGWVRPLE